MPAGFPVPGQVIGTAGASLKGAGDSWAANADVARVGRGGELRTGALLNALAAELGGPTVFHDLQVPGSNANLDHVVVSGRHVTVVDTKVWKPGTYWSVLGRTRRGRERFPYGDPAKVSLAWMAERLIPVLPGKAQVRRPVLLVWASNDRGIVNSRFLRVPGTAVTSPATDHGLSVAKLGRLVGAKSADQAIVQALLHLHSASSTPAAGGDVAGGVSPTVTSVVELSPAPEPPGTDVLR